MKRLTRLTWAAVLSCALALAGVGLAACAPAFSKPTGPCADFTKYGTFTDVQFGHFLPTLLSLSPTRRLRTKAAFSSRNLLSNPVISGLVFCPFGFEGKASRAFLRGS